MISYTYKKFWKLLLLLFAILIGLTSLIYTNNLVKKLKVSEREYVKIWAEATRLIALPDSTQSVDFVDFLSSIIYKNTTVPVILTNETDSIISSKNFSKESENNRRYMEKTLLKIKEKNQPIVINLVGDHYNLIYYKDSVILTMLIYYPYIQLGIIFLLILVSYLAFSSSRKVEQNQVWIGMSKETAHQLGTPVSSLAGWTEILQSKYPDIPVIRELTTDVQRLEKITERFSRIGAKPSLSEENIVPIINRTIEYLKRRASSKVTFLTDYDQSNEVIVPLNFALLEWVIENVSKNSIDSMEGEGSITYRISENDKNVCIDISDTGKGIPKSAYKKIFNTGFTTKQRGWGVGLSLAKRIVEEYHNGKIFVKYSELGKGSCIRIVINKKRL